MSKALENTLIQITKPATHYPFKKQHNKNKQQKRFLFNDALNTSYVGLTDNK